MLLGVTSGADRAGMTLVLLFLCLEVLGSLFPMGSWPEPALWWTWPLLRVVQAFNSWV
jgi:hypothetical protein